MEASNQNLNFDLIDEYPRLATMVTFPYEPGLGP